MLLCNCQEDELQQLNSHLEHYTEGEITIKKPTYYCYPAILTYALDSKITITFPDLPDCSAIGQNDDDALEAAKEALGKFLLQMENSDTVIPSPRSLKEVHCRDSQRATLVKVYMPTLRLTEPHKSVNRTITLPAWLNAAGLERGINFSQLLQDAIKKVLYSENE